MAVYKLKVNNINSKILLVEITDFVNRIIADFNIIWNSESQRETVLEVISEYMEDLSEDNKIEQWNVVCDTRNNKSADVKNKITHLDIEYRQYNCYNVSRLQYRISK